MGFSVQNNSGKASGLTGITGLSAPGIFNDATIFSDSYGAANVGNLAREDGGLLAEDGNFVFTFSGLDDSLTYDVTGGYDQDNANFNTIWDSATAAAPVTTDNVGGDGFATLTGLQTDGSGNLEITVTRTTQLFIASVSLTAQPGVQMALKGDVDLSGVVDFSDIAPFIAVLQGGGFQAEADCDCSTAVDFADNPAFIAILQNQ